MPKIKLFTPTLRRSEVMLHFPICRITSRTLPQATMTWSTLAHRWVIVSGRTMEWWVEINNTKRLVQARYQDTKKSSFKSTLETFFCFSSFSDEKPRCRWPRVLQFPPEEEIVLCIQHGMTIFSLYVETLKPNAAFWACHHHTTLPFKCSIFYNSWEMCPACLTPRTRALALTHHTSITANSHVSHAITDPLFLHRRIRMDVFSLMALSTPRPHNVEKRLKATPIQLACWCQLWTTRFCLFSTPIYQLSKPRVSSS